MGDSAEHQEAILEGRKSVENFKAHNAEQLETMQNQSQKIEALVQESATQQEDIKRLEAEKMELQSQVKQLEEERCDYESGIENVLGQLGPLRERKRSRQGSPAPG